mmetsp:Transcript_1638/g.4296  ORF Transcript_1638/g.4296 Transcript_1638/m.4296 type:complete len:265 (-) Transcript_1638:11-805(-)
MIIIILVCILAFTSYLFIYFHTTPACASWLLLHLLVHPRKRLRFEFQFQDHRGVVAPELVANHVRVPRNHPRGGFVKGVLRNDEIVQPESLVGFAVPRPLAPVRITAASGRVEFPKDVDEFFFVAARELLRKGSPFLLGDAGLLGQVLGAVVPDVQGFVGNVEISQPQDRNGFVVVVVVFRYSLRMMVLEELNKELVPLLGAVVEAFEFLSRVGNVHVGNGRPGKVQQDDPSLVVDFLSDRIRDPRGCQQLGGDALRQRCSCSC